MPWNRFESRDLRHLPDALLYQEMSKDVAHYLLAQAFGTGKGIHQPYWEMPEKLWGNQVSKHYDFRQVLLAAIRFWFKDNTLYRASK